MLFVILYLLRDFPAEVSHVSSLSLWTVSLLSLFPKEKIEHASDTYAIASQD